MLNIEIYYTRHDELILLAGKETNDEEVGKTLKELFINPVPNGFISLVSQIPNFFKAA